MNKKDKIPTARLCDRLSLAIPAFGIVAALVYIFPRPLGVSSITGGLLILLGFFVAATMVRALGIISQGVVDLCLKVGMLEGTLKASIEGLGKEADQNARRLRSVVDQVNCDARDMNQNIAEIKTFFEQIQKQLNLKK